jgi:energy-coupling factor transporter ATP-binding protein EcfA2
MTRRPGDFPPKTRRLIAERAGYRCSKPDCRRQTLGPGPGPLDVARIGDACHIFSAASGGPRGAGGLTLEERQSASNGIWLCTDHARLIDANQGRGYPAPLLRGWRQLHEAYLAHEMRGLVPPCAMITEVSVREGPDALTSRPIALSTLNIITGPNNSGKTTLLDVLARAGQDGAPAGRRWYGQLSADIRWFDPQPHLLQLHDSEDGKELIHDERRAPSMAAPYRTVTIKPRRKPPSGVDDWAALLGLDRHAFLAVLRDVPRCVRGEVTRVDISDGIPEVRLRSAPDPVRLDRPSWSADIALLETAIAVAQMHSVKGPTLLLLDDFGVFLHPVATRKLFQTLTSASQGFQTIVVTHQILPPEVTREWTITSIGHYEPLLAGELSLEPPVPVLGGEDSP